jgi:hypothetical protein
MRTSCADCSKLDGCDEDSRKSPCKSPCKSPYKSPYKSPQGGSSIALLVYRYEETQSGWNNKPETHETPEIRRLKLDIERASQDPAMGLPEEFEP